MDLTNDIQENYSTGFIKLYRSLKNKGWYKKSEYVHLWLHILIKATHKGMEVMFNGENIYLNPGQFITGRKALSTETGINESKIERILNFFEKNEQQIEQQKSNKNRIVSIVSWGVYQQSEQQSEQQLNNNRTTTEQQLNTYKNVNNIKNEKNVKNSPIDFSKIIELYGYCQKVGPAKKLWDSLYPDEQHTVLSHIPIYLKNHADNNKVNFTPDFHTYLDEQRYLAKDLPYNKEKKPHEINNDMSNNPDRLKFD